MQTLVPSTTQNPPRRTAPFSEEPGFYEPANLWLYGNTRLLESRLAVLDETFGPETHTELQLFEIERKAEILVLDGNTLVTGIHHAAHQRAAIVPLRWGAPRILVVRGGFYAHFGPDLRQEPFATARLWRYEFDPSSDLIVSEQAPDAPKSLKRHLVSIDRLIVSITSRLVPGLLFE